MTIEYREITEVYLDKKYVGSIRKVGNFYRYFPKNSLIGGERFATLKAVQKSIEEE